MPRYSSRRTTRRAPARRSGSYRRASSGYSAPRRSTSRRRSGGSTGAGRTIRIVIEQPQSSAIARPEMIGKMPVALRRSKSVF